MFFNPSSVADFFPETDKCMLQYINVVLPRGLLCVIFTLYAYYLNVAVFDKNISNPVTHIAL